MSDNSHHLILGELVDFLSGKAITDTHDERYRQQIARHLVNDLGFDKSDIEARREITIQTTERSAVVIADFLVYMNQRAVMMINYAPGSLVTRRLPTLALSRLIFDYQIPFVVVTNGQDAELISGNTGKVEGEGISAVPGPDHHMIKSLPNEFETVSAKRRGQAEKIAFACLVDGSCMVENYCDEC
ncbi:adenosine deaminase [Desulfobacter hydrogenophilus]|uniref:Adenosine deaminase n=1 Tax=Desulfobacter hydrogenophilus TaxID=2291 RepID=A0A328FAH5_9BACT|nr:type I restriction enzyme HsdR N-terminal domain-containing protein [Desulfobacter hydrogenophilus]NDY72136.1 type I restriction enzyme HsdR N-terminal domain-containing protein [Desulfobacter hydrogenophilus]QBH14861.1 adenosine deaminase [Desulfobacter hydrogenophilus]RAM01369.1 adenosine deaminase [Desulfobacter hydrogenophilus]